MTRPRFTLRTLLVVVTLVGCGLGYEVNWIRRRHAAMPWIEAHLECRGSLGQHYSPGPPRPPMAWWLQMLGEKSEPALDLYQHEEDSDEEFERKFSEAEHLFPETYFRRSGLSQSQDENFIKEDTFSDAQVTEQEPIPRFPRMPLPDPWLPSLKQSPFDRDP